MPSSDRVFLGYPLDILMNRSCALADYEGKVYFKGREFSGVGTATLGGMILPTPDSPGTGCILIHGQPGCGKTILAMQIAVAAVAEPNRYSSVFYSLEESVPVMVRRANQLGWGNSIREVRFLDSLGESSAPDEIGGELLRLMKTAGLGQKNGCVLLPMLSPRGIAERPTSQRSLFWERMGQIEMLLKGANWILRNQSPKDRAEKCSDICPIRVVCIDGLTALGEAPLTRQELHEVFELFRRNQILGVFTAEDPIGSGDSSMTSVMEYLSDVVIQLRAEEDKGYAVRYFEITKSRHQHEVYGRHAVRLQSPPAQVRPEEPETLKPGAVSKNGCHLHTVYHQAFRVFPSLHHVVAATQRPRSIAEVAQKAFYIGEKNLQHVILQGLQRPSVVTIRGPHGTFKSTIAHNFLLSGFSQTRYEDSKESEQPESALWISFHERSTHKPQPGPVRFRRATGSPSFEIVEDRSAPCDDTKRSIRYWCLKGGEAELSTFGGPRLIEIAFKSGAIMPEELVEIVRQAFLDHGVTSGYDGKPLPPIGRVVLGDVGMIGAAYPFLSSSSTAGELFLPTIVHIMRNKGVDLVITGTIGRLVDSDRVVGLAAELADCVLDCGLCEVFGDRHVVVTGDGLQRRKMGGAPTRQSEYNPGVVLRVGVDEFEIDLKLLQGLVGFDSGQIHRPGLSLQLFTEGRLQKRYNEEIERLVRSVFSVPEKVTAPEPSSVSVLQFGSRMSDPVHAALGVLTDKPIDRTVVCTVDEFHMTQETSGGRGLVNVKPYLDLKMAEQPNQTGPVKYLDPIEGQGSACTWGVPYYANVSLIAYREDVLRLGSNVPNSWGAWSNLSRDGVAPRFDFDMEARETLTCALLDAVVSGLFLSTPSEYASENWRKPLSPPGDEDIEREIGNPSAATRSMERGKALGELLRKALTQDSIMPQVKSELASLQVLCARSKKYAERRNCNGLGSAEPNSELERLSPNADIYLCWYSQLRDLVAQYPSLADKLRIAAWPGSGFRGDWSLGIVGGSTSEALGHEVLDVLCGRLEETKRFVNGVGLPVRAEFFSTPEQPKGPPFDAWPFAQVKLREVLTIHQRALKRSTIPGYREWRSSVYQLAEQLAFAENGEEGARLCIESLPQIVKFFDPSNG